MLFLSVQTQYVCHFNHFVDDDTQFFPVGSARLFIIAIKNKLQFQEVILCLQMFLAAINLLPL